MDEEKPELSWSRWYREAREEAAFRFGMRHIPKDRYKEQWAMGASVQDGVRRICDAIEGELYT